MLPALQFLATEGGVDVGQGLEELERNAAELAPLGEAVLGEEHVGEECRLPVADPVADEDRRASPPAGVLDRYLLARPAAGARTASIQVRELEGTRGPVDGVREHGHAEPRAHLFGVEAEAVGD